MRYPLKIVSVYCRNCSEKIFPKGGIKDLSVVPLLGHILSHIWSTLAHIEG